MLGRTGRPYLDIVAFLAKGDVSRWRWRACCWFVSFVALVMSDGFDTHVNKHNVLMLSFREEETGHLKLRTQSVIGAYAFEMRSNYIDTNNLLKDARHTFSIFRLTIFSIALGADYTKIIVLDLSDHEASSDEAMDTSRR